MIKNLKSLCMIIMSIFIAFSFLSSVAMKSSFAQNSKKSKGLKFQVPEDWPIEERGGLLGPIPTEEYMTMKFEAIEKEFLSIKSDLSSKHDELKSDIKSIELDFTKEINSSLSGMNSSDAQALGGNLTDVLARLDELESQIARIDRKISNKAAVTKSTTHALKRDLSALEKAFEELQVRIFKLDEDIKYVSDLQSQQ